ncbi:hypothetical protein C8R44DRAFT_800604 [Mycena epipterygia]|nr:hypothetical protein C8R44DRAFT_800604 [Mycena epipterygia]
MAYLSIRDAVKRSWVLVDVGGEVVENWIPWNWTEPCFTVVWTSSPLARRRHQFSKRFHAETWYTKPSTLTEIAAMIHLDGHDPRKIRERLEATGPVARTLFKPSEPTPDVASINTVIRTALENGGFRILNMEVTQLEWARHCMFLLRPQSQCHRHSPSFEFLSNFVVQQTTEQLARHFDAVRTNLIYAFDSLDTRSVAGKLVECALHRALMGGGLSDDEKIDLSGDLGCGKVAASIEIFGKAQDFVLDAGELGKSAARPLYLRPQAGSNFVGVDAIVVTKTAIGFVQTSVVESQSRAVRTLLQILARLAKIGFKAEVKNLPLFYCVVGTDQARVRRLVQEASTQLACSRVYLPTAWPSSCDSIPQSLDSGYRSWRCGAIRSTSEMG